MNQLEKRQDDLLNRRAKDYLQKKTIIDEEFYHKREINDSFYRLRNESLQRRVKGEQFCAKSNFTNNKKLITDMIRDTFEKKMEDLLEEKSKSEELFSRYAKKVKTPVEDLSTSSESEHETPEWIRKEEVRVIKYLQKKKRKIRQPCLIYSLPYSILQQDIKKINKSLLDANVNI
uniref:Uncharacterized protein n=1 Tax=Acrobeloides nanus TaxID=290746 RepID=A0A914BVX9_9BILA